MANVAVMEVSSIQFLTKSQIQICYESLLKKIIISSASTYIGSEFDFKVIMP